MTTENTRKALQNGARKSGYGSGAPYSCASIGTEANPALLLDAMVDDGMLRVVVWCPNRLLNHADELLAAKCSDRHVTRYEVIPPEPPHVHDWKVLRSISSSVVRIDCTCKEWMDVSATLPINIPGEQ